MSEALQPDLLAEETHSGRAWVPILLLAMIGPAIAWMAARTAFVLWPAILVAFVGIGACAMAWSEFQYRFLRHGVEIRMLGFRLRSIPKESIVSYMIEPWAFIRGRRQHSRIRLVQPCGAYQDVQWRHFSGAQRAGARRPRSRHGDGSRDARLDGAL